MRILHVITSLEKGGAERMVQDICFHLQKKPGTEVKLCILKRTGSQGEDIPTNIDWQLAPSYIHPSITGKTKADISPFLQVVNEFKPDIIHSHLFEAELVSRHQLFSNIKYFTHCHDNMRQMKKFSLQTMQSKVKLANYYERAMLMKKYKQCNNQFISISADNFKYFKENLPTPLNNNVHLLSNAIDFNRFNKVAGAKNISSVLQLLNIGSFKLHKNQRFLVDVVKNLKDKNIPVSLTLLGMGAEYENVMQRVIDYKLTNEIIFEGNVQNVEDYLKRSNLYIHAAYEEPFGLVFLEAMAAGLPVIALDGKGNRDLVKDGENGFFIYEMDVNLFADRIITLKNDNVLYQKMSRNGVEFARGFDIEKYTDRLLQLYHSA